MSSSLSSSSSATVRVDKATSDLLLGPDWTMNIDICDSINSNHWQAKEVVKALKKRLLHKNPKVQLLALTLLETMIKNCGEYVHSQIAERNILPEMIKIVRKKMDMQVRDKILDLLDSWQEAFGGPGGKYPQYYWAYEELRRSGVEFPQRSRDAAPIFTPPVTNSLMRPAQTGYGMPSNTSVRLDEAMASETENISLSNLDAMRSVTELLSDMLQAVNPNDREAVKDEIIVDLVSQCRSNQKKLMQTLSSTVNEELLARGLELNDSLQSLLMMHDAIASGSPLPSQVRDPIPTSTRDDLSPTSPFPIAVSQQLEDEEEDENDDFAQLARRRTKSQVTPSESSTSSVSVETGPSPVISTATSGPHNALALPDPPNPVKTSSKEQDMIDLLSITLSTSSISPNTPPSTTSQTTTPVSPATQGYPYGSQPFPGYQPQAAPVNNYVAPWAQPQMQQQQPMQQQQQPLSPPPPQQQPQYPQYSYNYPPPPWATSPVNMNQTPTYYQPPRPMQNYNSFPARGTNTNVQPANGAKTFVPSYRLFEDLNVLGNSDTTTTSTTSMTGQSMVGRRK